MEGNYVLGLSGRGCGTFSIETKGAAIAFAIMYSVEYTSNGKNRVNYKKAQKIFDFICKNVQLPDVRQDPMSSAGDMIKAALGGLKEKQPDASDG